MSLSDDINQLYWSHLCQRQGSYSVSRTWLWNAFQRAKTIEALQARLAATPPGEAIATLALWGLSQGGKSSSLQEAIDKPFLAPDGNADGVPQHIRQRTSVLQWDSAAPVVFGYDLNPAVVSLNPLSPATIDATACKTRFVLRAALPTETDILHPAQVLLSDKLALAKALAIGYINNIELTTPNNDPKRQAIAEATILDALQKVPVANVNDASFQRLMDFVAVLKAAKDTSNSRYRNIDDSLYERIIELPGVTSDLDAVFKQIFWANDAAISGIYDRASALIAQLGTKRIFASYAVVRLLLDMQIHAHAVQTADVAMAALARNQIERIRIEYLTPDIAKLHLDGAGVQDVANPDSFADLQAVISEIIIPVNKETLAAATNPQTQALKHFLEKANLLDLPGVTFMMGGLAEAPDIYTSVVKLGKTFSTATASSHEAMDDMCIFISLQNHVAAAPATVNLLLSGVMRWLNGREMKTKTVFTGVNSYIQNVGAAGKGALDPFDNFNSFGRIIGKTTADVIIAHYFFTTLAKHNPEVIRGFRNAFNEVLPAIQERFPKFELNEIIAEEGNLVDGRKRVLEFLAVSENLDNARVNLENSLRENCAKLIVELAKHTPDENTVGQETPTARAIRLSRAFKTALEAQINAADHQRLQELGVEILKFSSMRDESGRSVLPPFPPAFFVAANYWPYLNTVIPTSIGKKIAAYPPANFRQIFNLPNTFKDEDIKFFIRIIFELITNGNNQANLFTNFGTRWAAANSATFAPNANSDFIRKSLHNTLTLLIENEISGRSLLRFTPPQGQANHSPGPPPPGGIPPQESTHYNVIRQFLDRNERLQTMNVNDRNPQDGDEELLAYRASVTAIQ